MSENSSFDQLRLVVQTLLAEEKGVTPELIRQFIERFRGLFPILDEQVELLVRHFESIYEIHMDIGAVVQDAGFEPWLDAAKLEITPYYWNRYRQLLVQKKFSRHVITSLDDVTDRTLGLLENPAKSNSWDRRGMVVGHVQSGKTANYAGLICKAADAGYKLIVVIAGVHNNLRNQTQMRIDEGFVGRDSSQLGKRNPIVPIGVGKFDQRHQPVTFTSSSRDFDTAIATSVGVQIRALKEPAVLVIKKNPKTLDNLIGWLRDNNTLGGSKTIDLPMLLIDDEADNASINIQHGRGAVARINGQIRTLLKIFERRCYVGYTATPFANIFIDPETDDDMFKADLFPKNFIVSLDPPTNYFGPNRIFLDSTDLPDDALSGSIAGVRPVRHIEDNEDVLPLKHKITLRVNELPPSLRFAIRAFVLVRCIRLLRGHTSAHNSMLVNASRFTNVQNQLRAEIHEYLGQIADTVRVKGKLPFDDVAQEPIMADLRRTWEVEFSKAGPTWEQVYAKLHDAIAPIRAVAINSGSAGRLNYAEHDSDGLNVVAVGGFSLSRGLTLEGLSISYFLRNSTMYDTLMQMGRWFGYRPDYEDLCRVWMPEEADGWYAHIAESIEELRDELRSMESAGLTPKDFGLKVRSHPDTLIVTARNRMGVGQALPVRIGLGNKFAETTTLRGDGASIQANHQALKDLVAELDKAGFPLPKSQGEPGYLLRSAPVGPVADFIGRFKNDPASLLTESAPVRRYIDDRSDSELAEWDILFVSLHRSDEQPLTNSELIGRNVLCPRRTAGTKSEIGKSIRVTNKQRVASRGIERTGLSNEQIDAAENGYLATPEGRVSAGGTVNFPDRIYRNQRKRALLLIYMLDLRSPKDPKKRLYETPVVAWGISFPDTKLEENRVEYIVNHVWLREYLAAEADDDEGDDELEAMYA